MKKRVSPNPKPSHRRPASRKSHAARRGTRISRRGTLIVIGGHEQASEELTILREVAARTGNGRLVIAHVASENAKTSWEEHARIFRALGVTDVRHLQIERTERPDDARDEARLKIFDGATTVFFTDGDQLKITTRIGGTALAKKIFDLYMDGGLIAGTSAGASILGEMMLIGGDGPDSHKIGNWSMAPGLGLLPNMIFDQHFAQRGRLGRLLGAISLNPGILGIGIDENTAIIVEDETDFSVIGQNAVYVIDGRQVTFTNIAESAANDTMSMHNVRLHILSAGETFLLADRRPIASKTLAST